MSGAIKAEKSIRVADELPHAAAGNVLGAVTDSLPGRCRHLPSCRADPTARTRRSHNCLFRSVERQVFIW